jgi:hypothetical protein
MCGHGIKPQNAKEASWSINQLHDRFEDAFKEGWNAKQSVQESTVC